MVPVAEIADPKNNYNLTSRDTSDSTEPEDLQDIDATCAAAFRSADLDTLETTGRSCPGCALPCSGSSTPRLLPR